MSILRYLLTVSLMVGLVGFVLAAGSNDSDISASGDEDDGNTVLVDSPPDPPPGSGYFDGPEPIEVGPTTGTRDDDDVPPGATERWARTHSSGDLTAEVKNTTGRNAYDFHVRIIRPDNAYLKGIETNHDGFDWVEPDIVQGEDPAREAKAAVPIGGGDPLGDGEEMDVNLGVVDDEGNPVGDEDVKFALWWTTGLERNTSIHKKSTEHYGDDDPQGEQSSIIPDYDNHPVAVAWHEAQADAEFKKPMMSLAECFGYQFKKGSLLFRPAVEVDFVLSDETKVRVFNEDGVEVTGTAAMGVSNMRIDCDGNFVIDITRGDTELHLIIVVYDLYFKLRRDFTDQPVGTSRRVDVGGAALGGDMWNGAYALFELFE